MKKIVWENEPSENTPIDAENLNIITNYGIVNQYNVTTTTEINKNEDYTIPASYKVGDGVLDVYYQGVKLILGENYIEVGNPDAISNRIQFLDWNVPTGKDLQFVVRGEWL